VVHVTRGWYRLKAFKGEFLIGPPYSNFSSVRVSEILPLCAPARHFSHLTSVSPKFRRVTLGVGIMVFALEERKISKL